MASVEIRIPQLGEGLQEARIVRFLKQPGDSIQRDEPIFEMETDKAVMEIESPAEGTLVEWGAAEDQVLPIGAVIGQIRTHDSEAPGDITGVQNAITESFSADRVTAAKAAPKMDDESGAAKPEPLPDSPSLAALSESRLRNENISPRVRAYAREQGVSESDLARLAQSSAGRLLPEAIDRFLAGGLSQAKSQPAAPTSPGEAIGYRDSPLPHKQRTLVYRLQRATKDVIPAAMEMPVQWSAVEVVRAQMKSAGGNLSGATQFLLFAYCVAGAARNHPQFRSALLNDSTVRVFDHLHLGIAVSLPQDELLMARVENADALALPDFVAAAQDAIRRARDGQDQTTDAMQLSLTNMSGAGVRVGIPIIAAPAVATLFVGQVFDEPYPIAGGGLGFKRMCNMVLSFDHRMANGIGAARFLTEVRERVEGLSSEFPAAGRPATD